MTLAQKDMICNRARIPACLAGIILSCLPLVSPAVTETHRLLSADVVASTVNDNTIFAFFSNALYTCSFVTRTWSYVSAPQISFDDDPVRDLAVSPANPMALYLLTRDTLFVSADSGISWTRRQLASQTRTYHTVAPHPTQQHNLLLGTSDGAWISEDNGETFDRFFSRISPQENDVHAIAWDKDGNRVYLATRAAMFVSTDGGSSFQQVHKLPPDPITHIAASPVSRMHVAFVSGKRLFFSDSGLVRYWLVSELYDFSSCTSLNIAWNGADIIWSYPGGLLWGKEWLKIIPPSPPPATAHVPPEEEKPLIDETVYRMPDIEDAPAPSDTSERYQRVMHLLRREPSARDVIDASIEYARIHPDEIDRILRNLRHSTWLPDLRILGGVSIKDGNVYGTDGMATWGRSVRYRIDRGDDAVTWETGAEMSWRLGSFFYDTDEVRLDERRARHTELRENVANTVTIYYFQRRNYIFRKLFNPPQSYEELSRLTFQIEELTAKLDTLSGGFFTSHLPVTYSAHGVPSMLEEDTHPRITLPIAGEVTPPLPPTDTSAETP